LILRPHNELLMTFEQYENAFRIKAKTSSFSEENIVLCLNYAKPLIENDLPVIYNTTNLSALVGYKIGYLKKAATYTNHFYRKFEIKKKNGKLRSLKEPLPSLKEIQNWILENILYKVEVSKYAKAYVRKRNILDNVKYHRSRDKVLTLDIENFFGSIKRQNVETIFRGMNYSSNMSNLLSKLCCCDDVLPQGSATSPCLSNIYLKPFDKVISEYCNENSIRYTRYADDLAFSGKFDQELLIELVRRELKKIGLKLNEDKIKLMEQNSRQIITGIVVNDIIQIPKKDRNAIRQEVYYIMKFGLKDHLIRTKNTKSNYLKHLLGKINYAIYINPNDKEMMEYKVSIQSLGQQI
jgi:RNA-directed DNA polymerase